MVVMTMPGKRYECIIYSGKKNGLHFWTYSLMNLDRYVTETIAAAVK